MRLIFCIFVLMFSLYAQTSATNQEKVDLAKLSKNSSTTTSEPKAVFELLADNVNTIDNVVTASGNVILINGENYILANDVVYYANIKQAVLKGDVKIYKGTSLFARTDEAIINLNDNFFIASPLYMQDSRTGLWVYGDIASVSNGVYDFKHGTISGCSASAPIWRLDATSGRFDTNKSYMYIYNPVVYLGDIPIFYAPFVMFPTSDERSSGLLYPSFGKSTLDGFIYMQPIYVAVQDTWDMTITPQIRTSRGGGVNFEFRGIDPLNNRVEFNARYFRNFNQYVKAVNARNYDVYGFDFKYSIRNPFARFSKVKESLSDGFYVDFAYMNDIDYIRLKEAEGEVTSNSYTSTLNYFFQSEDNYLGMYLKYFLNLENLNNKTTFQTLPQFQYHKYLDQLFIKQILYSIDYKFQNITREKGYGYIQNIIKMPVGLNFSLFKKYLYLGLNADIYIDNIYLNKITNLTKVITDDSAQNNTISYGGSVSRDGTFLSTNYSISLATDIAKAYNKAFHTLAINAVFSAPFYYLTRGALATSSVQLNDRNVSIVDQVFNPSEVVNTTPSNKLLTLSMSNYVYNLKGRKLFSYKIAQALDFDNKNSFAELPLQNELNISPIEGLNLGLNFYYSFYRGLVDEANATIGYSKNFLKTELSYYFKSAKYLLGKKYDMGSNYLKFALQNDFGYFAFATNLGYDIQNNILLNWGMQISKNIRCFGFVLKYVQERRPILTNIPSDPLRVIKDSYIKLDFRFIPLTDVGFTYNID